MKIKMSSQEQKTERLSMRLYPADDEKLTYWAEKYDMSRAELLITAMHHYVGWRNGDYDLPRAETERLNQLIDGMNNLSSNQANLEKSILSSFDVLLGIIRGDNYLIDDDDGEL